MTAEPRETGRFSLRRWSQRKLELARSEQQSPTVAAMPATDRVTVPQAQATPLTGAANASEISSAASTAVELPPIESLTIDSDFTPFFQPQVDAAVKRAALKQLFRDPRFNVMDGLDTYIADYSLADPIPAATLDGLMQRRGVFALASEATDPAVANEGDRLLNAERGAAGAGTAAPPAKAVEPLPPEPGIPESQAAAAPPVPVMDDADAPPSVADRAAPSAADRRTGNETGPA